MRSETLGWKMSRFYSGGKGRDEVFLAGFIAMFLGQLIYMSVIVPVLPITDISIVSPRITVDPLVFWPSYATWTLVGFLMYARRIPEKKKYPDFAIVFGVLLFGSLAISKSYPIVATFTWAFFGIWLGVGFWAVGVVIARHTGKKSPTRGDVSARIHDK